ncbi:MAG: ATP-binding cassette domain-containing protein [Thermoanaerobaculia bacterium]
MLDIALQAVTFRHPEGFALRDVTLTFPRSTHTALAGPPACGASTLLRLIAGTLRPQSGDVIFGQRRVNDLKAANRPLLFVTSAIDVPQRWSVQHVLVAAVRSRSLDREDRHHEYRLAAEKWELPQLIERRISTLSSTEIARVQFARIELLRPAILIADRLLEGVSASARTSLADMFFRTLRVHGTTVVSAPSSREELATTDRIVVLNDGRVTQTGTAAEVFARPVDEAAAIAIGEIDEIPIGIRGTTVESIIGSWEVDPPPFQGAGIALVRPGDFAAARPGEDSDLIFGVEEAGFSGGRWIARGLLSGGATLRVELPSGANVHKGRLLALRYDPTRFTLIARERAPVQTTVPTDIVPPLSETR